MWRIDHYLTVDHDIVLQTFRKVSKHLEDRQKMGLSPGEEGFFFGTGGCRTCFLLAFDAFLTVIFPDTAAEEGPALPQEGLRQELLALSKRARCPVLSAVFPGGEASRGWLGICDGGRTAEGRWGVPGSPEPDFPLFASLLRLPGQENALRSAWGEKTPDRFLRAMEEAVGLPFPLPEELEGRYQKVEDRMAMKLYLPLTPAQNRFFYFPQEGNGLPRALGENPFSFLGRGSLHLYREDLEEAKLFEVLQSENELCQNKITALAEPCHIVLWKQSGAPFSPEETEKISLLLHCRAVSTLVCGEKAFALCAARRGERLCAACWQSFSSDAWGIEEKCRAAWQAWLCEYPHSDGLTTQEAGRLCGRLEIPPEPFIDAVRFGNLPYLLEKLPAVLGTHFEMPGDLKSFPSETFSCGRLYREPEKKGSNLWK